MKFINYIYINICDMMTKISFITRKSICKIITLAPFFISYIKSVSTDNIIKNKVTKNNIHKNNILNKCVCEYNISQECDWGWFVAIDECDV